MIIAFSKWPTLLPLLQGPLLYKVMALYPSYKAMAWHVHEYSILIYFSKHSWTRVTIWKFLEP